MNNPRISLAVFGNQMSNSGYQPLYWLNDPPQQLENLVPPGMDDNAYFFTLQILPAHTQFTLVHNRVSSYGAWRPGVLKIAIALPKGYRIVDGISPLEVLLDVREKFIETCMTCREGHHNSYNFKEKLADARLFADIVNAYQLEPDDQPHLPMTGTEDALLLLDDTAISQLFAAPQHDEFCRFRRIVIANKGNATAYKTLLSDMLPQESAAAPVPHPDAPEHSDDTVLMAPRDPRRRQYLYMLCLLLLMAGGIVAWNLMSSKDKTAAEHQSDKAALVSKPDTAKEGTKDSLSAQPKDSIVKPASTGKTPAQPALTREEPPSAAPQAEVKQGNNKTNN